MATLIERLEPNFAEIGRRAQTECVILYGVDLPAGCSPASARVGVEAPGAEWVLFVDRTVRYSGRAPDVADWISRGEKRFPSGDALLEWIRSVGSVALETTLPSAGAPRRLANELTDVAAVMRFGQESRDQGVEFDETKIYERVRAEVCGQDAAVKTLAQRVARHAARTEPRRPATFFAVGPTGVGKTRTAEVLAMAMRRTEASDEGYGFLRLDMSEYQEAHRVSQLLGAPQGYVGHGEGAELVDRLRANPRTVVLFDEIEKAHKSILVALMNAMDAGRITSSHSGATGANGTSGRTVDCRHAIFVFTSNLDSSGIIEELGDRDLVDQNDLVDEVCRRRIRAVGVAPELVGRVGTFLVFKPLDAKALASVVTLAVRNVGQEYGVDVSWVDPRIVANIVERSARGASFGARPFEYLVDETLGDAFRGSRHLQGPVRVVGDSSVEILSDGETRSPGTTV